MSIEFLFVFTLVFALGVFETAIFKTNYIGHPLGWIINDTYIYKERKYAPLFELILLNILIIVRYFSGIVPILSLLYQAWFWFIHILKITQ